MQLSRNHVFLEATRNSFHRKMAYREETKGVD